MDLDLAQTKIARSQLKRRNCPDVS